MAPSASTQQRVTDCHCCVTSRSGRGGRARSVEEKSGQGRLSPSAGVVNRRKLECVERLAVAKAGLYPGGYPGLKWVPVEKGEN